ncbi:MAG: hypothetical protein KY464_09655 [Gemmatimonadetes bacterium]|nr:hypothetical protein [Gemmatimonadota bacterium]
MRNAVIDAEHRSNADTLQRIEAAYREKEDLILVGAYQKGTDANVDTAIELRPQVQAFLQQTPETSTPFEATQQQLRGIAAQAVPGRRARA